MEPRRTQLCMLSGMLSSFLILTLTLCPVSTYECSGHQIRATREPPSSLWNDGTSSEGGSSATVGESTSGASMTLDRYAPGVPSARAGRLARMPSLLDPELR